MVANLSPTVLFPIATVAVAVAVAAVLVGVGVGVVSLRLRVPPVGRFMLQESCLPEVNIEFLPRT